MNYSKSIILVVIAVLGLFTILRGYISNVVQYCLNKSARKKRKKGQNLKEWFWYTRYRDIIPRDMLLWYFVGLITIVAIIGATIIMILLKLKYDTIFTFSKITLFIVAGLAFLQRLMFDAHPFSSFSCDSVADQKKMAKWIKRKRQNRK